MVRIAFGATFAAVAMNALLGLSSPAEAASCGALNQKPCTIFQRIPSCDAGLYEDFGKGKCLRKTRPGVDCGKLNQRACKVWERVPSCNSGLVEKLGAGICVAKAVPGRDCGNANQRACNVWERVPSCNPGLVEVLGKGFCADPSRAGVDCGGEGQRPCTITERIPSCNIGLVEDFAKGKCIATADTPRIRIAEAKLAKLAPFIASKLGFAQQVASDPRIKASLKSDPKAVSRMVNLTGAGQPASNAFGVTRTITIGASAGAKVIFGGAAGAGVALDISTRDGRPTGLPPYVYGTADYSKSLGIGASAGIDVGFWICQNNKIGGDSWGVEFGVWDIGVLAKTIKTGGELSELVKPGFDFGVALWFDYNNVFQGFTMTPGIGAGADFGGLVKAGTIVEDDPSVNCDGSSKTSGGTAATSVTQPATPFLGGDAPQHGAPAKVTFYQHCGYQGYSVTVPAGRHSLSSLRAMGMRNDDVSSIRVARGSVVRIYVHDGFGGHWQDFSGDVPYLVEHKFNDTLSSAVVQ